MAICLIILTTLVGTLALGSQSESREIMLHKLRSIEGYYPGADKAVSSLIEQTVKTGQKSALTSKGRRRTVFDTDCDLAESGDDSIEDVCHNYRYTILKSLQPGITNITTVNASISLGLKRLDDKFAMADTNVADPSATILTNLYQQRIAIFGGLDPISSTTEIGAIARSKAMIKRLLNLQRSTEAVLDTEWTNINSTQSMIADRLYNQVFKYATETEKFLALLHNRSRELLEDSTVSLQELMRNVNTQLLNITASICEEQIKINTFGRNLTDVMGATIPELEDIIEALVDRNLALLDDLSVLDEQNDKQIDKLLDQAEDITAGGLNSAEAYIYKFAENFKKSLEQLVSTFVTDSKSQSDKFIGRMYSVAVNETQSVLDEIQKRRERSAKISLGFDDKLKDIKNDVERKVDAFTNKTRKALDWVDDFLATTRNNATSAIGQLKNQERNLNSQMGNTEADVMRSIDLATNQASDLAMKAASNAEEKFSDLANQLNSVQLKAVDGLSSQSSRSETKLVGTDETTANSRLGSMKQISAQTSAIAVAGSLGDAKLGVLQDVQSGTIKAGFKPLFNAVDNLGQKTLDAVTLVSASVSNIRHDVGSAQRDAHAAVTNSARQLSVITTVGDSNLRKQMVGNMSESLNKTDTAETALKSTFNKLSTIKGNLDSLKTNGESVVEQNDRELVRVGGRLNSTLQDSLRNFKSKFAELKNEIAYKMGNQLSEINIDWANRQSEFSTRLGTILHDVKTMISKSPSVDPDIQEAVRTIASIEKLLSEIEVANIDVGRTFKSRLESSARTTQISKYLTQKNSQFAKFIDKLKREYMKKLSDTYVGFDNQVRGMVERRVPSELRTRIADELAKQRTILAPTELRMNSSIDFLTRTENDLSAQLDDRVLLDEVGDAETRWSRSPGTGQEMLDTVQNYTKQAESQIYDSTSAVESAMTVAKRGSENMLENIDKLRNEKITADKSLTREANKEVSSTLSIANHLDGLIENSTVTIAQQQERGRARMLEADAQLASTVDNAQVTAAYIQGLLSNFEKLKLGAQTSLSTHTSGANQLIDTVSIAANSTRVQLSALADRESRQAGFEIESAGGIVSRIMNGIGSDAVSNTVATIGEVVGVDPELSTDELSQNLTRVAEILGSNSSALSAQINGSLSHIGGSLESMRAIHGMQLSQVGKFIEKVFSSWMTYTDYESSKLSRLATTADTSFQFLQREVDSDAARGYENLNKTSSQLIKNAGDIAQARNDELAFINQTNQSMTAVKDDREKLVNEVKRVNITDTILAIEKKQDADFGSHKTAVASALARFYSSIDQMVDQVVSD